MFPPTFSILHFTVSSTNTSDNLLPCLFKTVNYNKGMVYNCNSRITITMCMHIITCSRTNVDIMQYNISMCEQAQEQILSKY